MSDAIAPVFLQEPTLVAWKRPAPAGMLVMNMGYDGSTELVANLGLVMLDEQIGDYRVFASAAKYRANIARIPEDRLDSLWNATTTNLPEEYVLFNGNIQIYRAGVIPGTNVEGHDLVCSGALWLARQPVVEFIDRSLRDVIFDSGPTPSRVEAIIEGYAVQRYGREKARSEARYRAFEDGRSSERGCRG